MRMTSLPAVLTACVLFTAAAADAGDRPTFYVSPAVNAADIGVGDFFTKWLMPVVDLEERGRYAAANAALGSAPSEVPRVVFLGDSITEGWTALEGSSFGPGPHLVLNRGISGQTSTHMLLRFQSDVMALHPRVLVLLAGTNDIRVGSDWMTEPTALQLQRLKDNLATMVDAARAGGVSPVLCTLPPVHDYTFDPGRFPVRSTVLRPPGSIIAVNSWLADLACQRGVPLADYHAALVDERGFLRRELSDDGLHPNEEGYRAMLAVIVPPVQHALAASSP